jgi:hypothetical protein
MLLMPTRLRAVRAGFISAIVLFSCQNRVHANGLPDCNTLTFKPADVREAANAAFDMLGLDTWEDLREAAEHVANDFKCAIPVSPLLFSTGFEIPTFGINSISQPSKILVSPQCQRLFCEEVDYCGKLNSTQSIFTLPATSQLNRLCYEHDRCYDFTCETRSQCIFSDRNDRIEICDRPLENHCKGDQVVFTDITICAGVTYYLNRETPKECAQRNCSSPNRCAIDSGTCIAPSANVGVNVARLQYNTPNLNPFNSDSVFMNCDIITQICAPSLPSCNGLGEGFAAQLALGLSNCGAPNFTYPCIFFVNNVSAAYPSICQ